MATKDVKSSGSGAGERRLNGPQTTGREFRNLSEPIYNIKRTNDLDVPMRDGVKLKADLFQPDMTGRFPALIAASPYPRQIQDFGLPMGMVEAGASDFFVPDDDVPPPGVSIKPLPSTGGVQNSP